MGAVLRFQPGQTWAYKDQLLSYQRALGDNLHHFMVERTLAPFQIDDGLGLRAPDDEWALGAFARGELKRVSTGFSFPRGRKRSEPGEYGPEEATALDCKAKLRRFVLRGLDELNHHGRGPKAIKSSLSKLWAANPDIAAEFPKPPAPTTIRRWLDFRGTPGERPSRQMVSLTGKVPRRRRISPITLTLLQRTAVWYWTNPKASISDAYYRVAARVIRINRWRKHSRLSLPQLKRPAFETVRQEIRKLECRATYTAKFGKKRADQRFKPMGKGLSATRFLQLGCMDHTVLDGVAVLDADYMLPIGRPWLTVLIDVHTRCVVSFVLSFEPPSLYQATECIKRANRPKLHLAARARKFGTLVNIFGRFDEIVVDNGWEFSGSSFQDAMADLGMTVRWAPVASPTYKAIVERFFGVLNHLLNQKLPGGTLNPQLLRELGYDPYKDAVLTLEEIEDLIWEALCVYHIDEHSGIGQPPAAVWQRNIDAFSIDVIGDDSQLDRMAGKMIYPRTLDRGGVELHGLRFHDPSATGGLLEDLIGAEPQRPKRKGSATVTVKVKYNPANLAEIHVWNHRRNRYVTLPCTDQRYAKGISFWHHTKLQEWARQEGLAFSTEEDRILAKEALNAKIFNSAPDLRIRQRKAAARLMHTPRVADVLEPGTVALAYAPSRHDGMAPVIVHEALAAERTDGTVPPNRPARQSRPKPLKAKPKKPSKLLARSPLESDDDLKMGGEND